MARRPSTILKKLQSLGPEGGATADYLEGVAAALREGPLDSALPSREWDRLGGVLIEIVATLRAAESGEPAAAKKTAEKKSKKTGPSPPATTPQWKAGVKSAKVYVDGACRGNPGIASGGIAFLTMEGATLHEMAVPHGDNLTNNQSEYQTLHVALATAAAKGIESVFAFADSELMVKQIRGEYKIKNPDLAARAARIQATRRRFRQFSIAYVPRAQNARADELANYALDHPDG